MTDIVHVENLVKRYDDLIALDHFNLSIAPGEIFGLLGPNGSGKTTSKTLTFTMSAGTDTENGKRLCRQATAWLVVHARRYGIDSLRANGMRWNRTDGVWAGTETGDLTITATLA